MCKIKLNQDFNFVVLGSPLDLYVYSFSDLDEYENAIYIKSVQEQLGKFKSLIYRIHNSKTTNKFFTIPLKHFWNPFLYKNKFTDDKPLCFICFGYWARLMQEHGLADYLKKAYPDSKVVWYLYDLFHLEKQLYKNKPIDIFAAKSIFDLIVSFDHYDCKKYGLHYHPLVFSSFHGSILDMPHVDVYFLGKAKNRLNEIINTYDILEGHGLVLDFYIVDAAKEQCVSRKGIHYIAGMSYDENLQHIIHSNCVLEIMQCGGHGFTQRCVEILGLNKKLLTNNIEIESAPFFNPAYMSYFAEPSLIDINFIENIKDEVQIDYKSKHIISPISLLNFISSKLREDN